eukprot:scaffold5600_cov115-Isochrysis_galbana.AAC.3
MALAMRPQPATAPPKPQNSAEWYQPFFAGSAALPAAELVLRRTYDDRAALASAGRRRAPRRKGESEAMPLATAGPIAENLRYS